MEDRAGLGQNGEQAADKFLRGLGHRIVTRNYRCPVGEIDLISLDRSTIVFVEVKTRRDREHADPQDAVNRDKQHRLARAAEYFLRQTRSEMRDYRFDVVAITAPADEPLEIEHLIDAFTPT